MKRLILATVFGLAACVGATSAFAGSSLKDGPALATHDRHCGSGPFAGAYIGGSVGIAHSDFSHSVGSGGGDYTSLSTLVTSHHKRNAVAGIGAGYNWQCDRFVFGIVGDINFGKVQSWTDYGAPDRITASLDHFGTLRARAGIAHDNVLFYLTGGLAFGSFDVDVSGCCTANDSFRDTGFAWGGGIEFNRGRWSLSAEVLRVDFGTTRIDYVLAGPCGGPFCSFGTEWDKSLTVARIGINMKLHHKEHVAHQPMK